MDLRSLTKGNQELFWTAIKKGKDRLTENGEDYSPLSVDFFNVFYDMFERAEKGEPPMELTDWNKIAEPCTEQNGPGWEK